MGVANDGMGEVAEAGGISREDEKGVGRGETDMSDEALETIADKSRGAEVGGGSG